MQQLARSRRTAVAQLVERQRYPAVTAAVKLAAISITTSGFDFQNKRTESTRNMHFLLNDKPNIKQKYTKRINTLMCAYTKRGHTF